MESTHPPTLTIRMVPVVFAAVSVWIFCSGVGRAEAVVEIDALSRYSRQLGHQQEDAQTHTREIRRLVKELAGTDCELQRGELVQEIAQHLARLEQIAGKPHPEFSVETDAGGTRRVIFPGDDPVDRQGTDRDRAVDARRESAPSGEETSEAVSSPDDTARPSDPMELMRKHQQAIDDLSKEVEQGRLDLSEYFKAIAPHAERIEAILRGQKGDYFARSGFEAMEDQERLDSPDFDDMSAEDFDVPEDFEPGYVEDGEGPITLPPHDPMEALAAMLKSYQQAVQRFAESVMPLHRLLMEGLIEPDELEELMSYHTRRLQKNQEEFTPVMEKLAEEMQRRMVARLGAPTEGPGLSDQQLAQMQAAIDATAAELEALARRFEYVAAAAQQRRAAARNDDD